ncbi:hypothetical protein AN191_04135 [Loktanella sp. 5RATIMAR09]|nr:hypothetical protein AN191_04135 [Loktanella sp. 5RATIMAR09]
MGHASLLPDIAEFAKRLRFLKGRFGKVPPHDQASSTRCLLPKGKTMDGAVMQTQTRLRAGGNVVKLRQEVPENVAKMTLLQSLTGL